MSLEENKSGFYDWFISISCFLFGLEGVMENWHQGMDNSPFLYLVYWCGLFYGGWRLFFLIKECLEEWREE